MSSPDTRTWTLRPFMRGGHPAVLGSGPRLEIWNELEVMPVVEHQRQLDERDAVEAAKIARATGLAEAIAEMRTDNLPDGALGLPSIGREIADLLAAVSAGREDR